MAVRDTLDRSDALVRQFGPFAAGIIRGGLGLTILLAGLHKLVAPEEWHAYLAPPFVDLWPTAIIGLDPTFVLFGVSEVVFGLLLLADWHTPTVAILTALSLLGVVINLAVAQVFGLEVVDVLVRDLGLTALATGVALSAGQELTTSTDGRGSATRHRSQVSTSPASTTTVGVMHRPRGTSDMGATPDEPCERCGGETVVRPLPPDCRGLLSEDPAMVQVCQRCLAVTPAVGQLATQGWDPETVSPALPADPKAAIAVALLVDLLSSLALNRSAIEQVVEYLEAEAGVDPLLAIQRIASDDNLAPTTDLERREHQLAQMLGEGS